MSDDPGSSVLSLRLAVCGRQVTLSLLRLSALKAHERTIPRLLASLERDIAESGVLRDPIVADARLGLVIDGAHRLEALRRLGAEVVPAVTVDYFSEEIEVKRWFRMARFVDWGALECYGSMRERMGYREFLRELDSGGAAIGIYSDGEARLVRRGMNAMEISRVLEEVCGMGAEYVPEHASPPRGATVVGYRSISKGEVVEVVRRGGVFTHKFTRHVVPLRLLGLNVPIELLRLDRLDELRGFLSSLRLRSLGRGVVVGGRFYEEEVAVGYRAT